MDKCIHAMTREEWCELFNEDWLQQIFDSVGMPFTTEDSED